MLFNSYTFIVIFLPVALIIYYFASAFAVDGIRRACFVAISIVFYAFGAARFLPLLLVSAVVNFVFACAIQRYRDNERVGSVFLPIGVCLNLALLFYYKYADFALAYFYVGDNSNQASSTIILPLAISFYTFQQIGLLIDVSRNKATVQGLLQYLNFVFFFPSLISGPIVKYTETVPQIEEKPLGSEVFHNIMIGLTIFSIGLFKKAIIADSIAIYTGPVIHGVGTGEGVGFVVAWTSALLYTLQIYFDFSGYSDMAIGVARMFGVVLPLNFHSPLKSDGFVEIWRRWHMTLGRWVQSYIFQPLSVPLARFASDRNYVGLKFLSLSTFLPTIVSMIVLGVWHGPGANFFLFGLMNGLFMVINEVWQNVLKQRRKRLGLKKQPATFQRKVFARGLTLLAFVLSCVPFAYSDIDGTRLMFTSMLGLGSLGSTPSRLAAEWPFGQLGAMLLLIAGYFAVFCLPNTQQIMGRFSPCLEWDKWRQVGLPLLPWHWKATTVGAMLSGATLFAGFVFIARGSLSFIYFGF
ncbi:MAG: hypothetical protein NTX28_07145 [Novosphingobium sp.]|nr:hypothetical protein [Novosphingobium sp.]